MADYYVNGTSGSDSSNGLTEDTAWLTIAKVVATSLVSGDDVYFQAGDTWREQLDVPSSGSESNHIKFSRYGTGENPKIMGSEALVSWTTEVVDDNYTNHTGASNEAITTPHAAALNFSGTSFRLEIDLVIDDVSKTLDLFIAKDDVGDERSWNWGLSSGQIGMYVFDSGAAKSYFTAHGDLVESGRRYRLRADYTEDDGGGNSQLEQYYSINDGETWSSFGTVVVAETITIDTDEALMSIGADTYLTPRVHDGKIYEAAGWSDLDKNALVFQCDLNDGAAASATFEGANDGITYTLTNLTVNEAQGTSYYDSSFVTQPGHLGDDNRYVQDRQFKRPLGNIAGWGWDSGNSRIYFRSVDNDHPDNHDVEAGYRTYGIDVGTNDYITIEDMDVSHVTSHGIRLDGTTTSIHVLRVRSHTNNGSGIFSFAASGDTVSDVSVLGGEYDHNGMGGIIFSEVAIDSLIDNANIHHNSQDGDIDYTGGVRIIGARVNTNCIVQNCQVHNNGKDDTGTVVANSYSGPGIWFDSVDNGSGTSQCMARYNVTWNNSQEGIFFENSKGAEAYYNISRDNDSHGLYANESDAAYPNEANRWWNNISVNNGGDGLHNAGETGGQAGSCTTNHWINNISTGNTGAQLSATVGGENDGTNGHDNVYTYNCLGVEDTSFVEWGLANFDDTYSDWETALGSESSSVEAGPEFENADNNNYRIQHDSPCISAGSVVGLTRDRVNTTVPQGDSPDVGVYEYVAPHWSQAPGTVQPTNPIIEPQSRRRRAVKGRNI